MNLTTTRAERTACAGQCIALTQRSLNQTTNVGAGRFFGVADGPGHACDEVQRDRCPVQTQDETFGMVLLGIGYDSTVA